MKIYSNQKTNFTTKLIKWIQLIKAIVIQAVLESTYSPG